MKFLYFFLFLWVIYALLDPDPATQINADRYGSGSETLLSDVKNCTVQAIFCTEAVKFVWLCTK
jgi:hypothetical protein